MQETNTSIEAEVEKCRYGRDVVSWTFEEDEPDVGTAASARRPKVCCRRTVIAYSGVIDVGEPLDPQGGRPRCANVRLAYACSRGIAADEK